MLRTKSSQLSFYGNHIYDRVIPGNHFLQAWELPPGDTCAHFRVRMRQRVEKGIEREQRWDELKLKAAYKVFV